MLGEGDPVRAAVDRYLDRIDAAKAFEGFTLDEVELVDGTQVTVRASATVRLPFVGPITDGRRTVTVRTVSTARNRLAPP